MKILSVTICTDKIFLLWSWHAYFYKISDINFIWFDFTKSKMLILGHF